MLNKIEAFGTFYYLVKLTNAELQSPDRALATLLSTLTVWVFFRQAPKCELCLNAVLKTPNLQLQA